jgi:hypothetical protein
MIRWRGKMAYRSGPLRAAALFLMCDKGTAMRSRADQSSDHPSCPNRFTWGKTARDPTSSQQAVDASVGRNMREAGPHADASMRRTKRARFARCGVIWTAQSLPHSRNGCASDVHGQ